MFENGGTETNGTRFRNDASMVTDFILNNPAYAGGSILVADRNFGCGSSREHAAWALGDYGFRVVIAPSFADIFYSNAAKNGLLTIELPQNDVRRLLDSALSDPGYELHVDLESRTVNDVAGWKSTFRIDDFRRKCLMEGADDIALTLKHEAAIARYEAVPRQA